jgi:two-component system nitrate/nitrite sensor histidine kinase NarX
VKSEAAHLTEACPGPANRFSPGEGDSSANSVLTEFLGLVVRLTGARAGAIRAPTADSSKLRLIASVGLPNEVCERDAIMPASCGMCGAALQSALTRQATRRLGCEVLDAQSLAGGARGRALAVPLDHRDRPIGVLNLFFSEGHDPPAGITHLLRPFGQLLGLALENERLARENLQTRVAQERQSMAADIHDALAQSLTFVRMRMSLLDDALETKDIPTARSYWSDASDELRNAHGRLREMISMYRAGMDSRGLMSSLSELATGFRRRTGIDLHLDCRVTDVDLPTEQQLQIFYIVQEALANVGKHSGARHARLLIDRSGRDLQVIVEDDGRGPGEDMLDPRVAGRLTEAGHHGLQIMRERAGRAGGRLNIGVLPDGGTRITLTVDNAIADDAA